MDLDYLLFLQGIREDWGGRTLFELISAISYSPLTAAIPAILFWCVNKQAGTFLLFNGICGRVIVDLIKGTFCVYRPWIKEMAIIPDESEVAKASSYSFPSGHTQFATSIWGGFAFFYRKILAKPIIAFFALIVLLVAFSRNFLGLHTPQDVLSAMLVSVGMFVVSEKIFTWIGRDEGRQFFTFIVGLITVSVIFMWLYFKPYPEDFLNGKVIVDPLAARAEAFDALGFGLAFFLGWFMELRLINFKTNVSPKDRLWRVIIGFAILGVISVAIQPLLKIFLGAGAYKFFRGFLPFFAILFVIPLIFTKVEQRFKR